MGGLAGDREVGGGQAGGWGVSIKRTGWGGGQV